MTYMRVELTFYFSELYCMKDFQRRIQFNTKVITLTEKDALNTNAI